jgi:flagellar M-ring protein FliF
VPAEQVHDMRLKLAAQGLPKGGNVGFELMENQKLGVSQFPEQVNYQRALEGELARSINRWRGRERARAPGPAQAVGVRARPAEADRLGDLTCTRPHAGPQQTGAIVHLVASSVPN